MVLVDRSHRRRIALTQEGQALLPLARDVARTSSRLDAEAAAVIRGDRQMIRVALLSEPSGVCLLALAMLCDHHESWSIVATRMTRLDAGRAMAIGGLECAIGAGTDPLRTEPGINDRRPNRLERTGSITAPFPDALPLRVSWRRSWTDDPHARRFIHRLRGLREQALDERSPGRHDDRLRIRRRRLDAQEEIRRYAMEVERDGVEAAKAARRAREGTALIARMRRALTRGGVPLHLWVAWLVHFGYDAVLPWPPVHRLLEAGPQVGVPAQPAPADAAPPTGPPGGDAR